MQKTPSNQSPKPSLGSKKKVVFILIAICFFTSLGIGIYAFLMKYFELKIITINTAASQQTLQGLSPYKNANVLFLNEHEVEQQIYKSNSDVKKVLVTKKLPSTLQVTAIFYTPLAQLEVSEGYFILSNDGRVLKKVQTKSTSLPIIHYYQKLSYGAFQSGSTMIFKDILASLVFLQRAEDIGVAINSIDIHSFNMIALNTDKQRILFSLEKSQRDQLYQFERVMHELKIKGQQFKTLDLRFERVIIAN